MRHLIDPTDLTVAETEQIVALAEDIIANRAKYSEACKGKKLATLFYEPSTRTRLSFTSAMMELGGSVIGFSDANSSSVSKGETVADTVRVIRCFADIIAMRHFKEGAPLVASQYAGVPVINAGDGSHSHPTQTLTDLLTIKREKGRFDNMTIGFCGDLKFGRTVHSLIKALSRYSGIKVILIAPQELRLPDYMLAEMSENSKLEFREVETMEEVMPELDVLYMTRVQKERFLDEEEFDRVKNSFVLNPEKLGTAKKDMIILHPLPRVNEITRAVDNDSRAAYFRQVENGKFVRMALILTLLRWADRNKPFERTPVFNGEYVVNEMECSNRRCISATEDVDQLFYRTADGTKVCMNALSELHYPTFFIGRERKVQLKGEAFFDVSHDRKHPFVVETYACDVEVLGTKFNVKARSEDGEFVASLVEGKVRVTDRFNSNNQVELHPREQVTHLNGRLILGRIPEHEGFLWREGLIAFRDASFGDLLDEFEKYYGVKIEVRRQDMPTNLFTGKIRISEGIDHALWVLQQSADFQYTRNELKDMIYIH